MSARRKPKAVLPGLPRPAESATAAPLASTSAAPIDMSAPHLLAAQLGERIVDIFERQRFFLPTIAFLNGVVIMRDGWDHALQFGDVLFFLQLPAGGGGKKDIFRFVLQLAVTVAAAYFLGPAGLGLTGTALRVGVAVATMAGGYLINTLLPPTAAAAQGYNSGEAASPTYSLTPTGNAARLGAMIPKLYGRHIVTPDFAALPYTEYAGNELYLYQLFSAGSGLYQTHQINIARTEAWNDTTGYTDAFEDIEFEIVAPGNKVTLFPTAVVTSVEVSGQTLKGPNEEGAGWIGPFPICGPDDEATSVAFDVVFRGGAGRAGDDGKISERQITVRQEIQKIDKFGAPIGDWILLDEAQFSFATRTAQRASLRYPVERARYQGRMKRINDATTETREWDEVTWEGLRAYLPSDDTFPCQVIAAKFRASNQLSAQASRSVTVVQTSMLPTYDGATWSAPVATRAIFDIAMDVLRNEDYSVGHPLDRIDVDTLYSMHATWTARGDTFDGVFDQTQSVWDVLTDVLRVGRARPIEIGDTISFVRDEKQTIPKMMVTPRQITEGSFTIDYALFGVNTPDDVLIEYVDERTWDMAATVRATLEGSPSKNPARQRIKGIVDRHRAWQFGMYMAAQNKYRREFPSCTTEYDGSILSPMDLVPVAHPLCDWGRPADVVEYDPATRKLTLSQKAAIDQAAANYVSLRKRNGAPWGPVKVTKGPSAYSVIMDAGELASIIATQGDLADWIVTADDLVDLDEPDGNEDVTEPTVAVLGHGEMYMRDCKLIGVRNQGDKTIALALVADDTRVYEAGETGEPPEEEAPSRLPVTQSGPEIKKLDVVVRGTRFFPIIDASIQPAPGTLNIIWQRSYDHVHWDQVQDGGSITWTGEVSPTTVWLRVTAIGAIRGPFKEWFANLTATEAPPAAVSGVSVETFVEHAWIRFTPAAEDGIAGVIAKVSTVSGFDPETEGDVAYDDILLTRITVDITAAATVYVRIACYNVFGKTGLNWSSELAISARHLDEVQLSSTLRDKIAQIAILATAITNEQTVRQSEDEALASLIDLVGAVVDDNTAAIASEATARVTGDSAIAAAISTVQTTVGGHTSSISTLSESVGGISARQVVKVDSNGYVVGTELANGGPGQSAFTLLIDKFLVAKPGAGGIEPTAVFQIKDGVVTLSELGAKKIITEYLSAVWASIGTLQAGKIQSVDGKMVIDFNDGYIQMDY